MTVVRDLLTALVVSLLLASRPAAAQQQAPSAPSPLIGPSPTSSPTSEVALGGAQLFVGALATVGASAVLLLPGAAAHSPPVAIVGLGVGPGIGGWAVCGIGRMSSTYEGDCTGTIVGSYLGFIALGVSAGFIGYYGYPQNNPDGGLD